MLRLALAVAENRGRTGDEVFAAARGAGLTDEEIVETIANTVRNMFTNYVNESLDVDVEWPLVTPFGTTAR
ncbi:hypothetical protein [Streptomyces sp. ISL-86]|uniref:hypothetical protein n=1 Tax=Streptomyces sp. ISL-86 TaxID=2819187 RepID=UPI001BE72AC3|nr:hypothetical protein [Streptomyces sp. ISL-86]MBT2458476.1 hypothetical protein [Streptomyces sp. ISL-86]